MKDKRINIILVLIMVIGVGLMLYPFISNTLHERRQDKIIVESKKAVDGMEDDNIQNMLKEAQEYNERLLNSITLSDPFSSMSINQSLEGYYDILNMNEQGLMGYIEIPRLNLYETIYHGTSEEVLAKGVGHLSVSSFPVGGSSTHALLSAHTGLPKAELFTNLPEMKEGDIFYIHILNEVLAYEVDQIKIVEPNDTKDIQIVEGEDYVTLITCTPYGLNTHRYLVRGKRVEYTPEVQEIATLQQKEGIKKEQWSDNYISALIKGALIAILIIIIIFIIYKYYTRSIAEADEPAKIAESGEKTGKKEKIKEKVTEKEKQNVRKAKPVIKAEQSLKEEKAKSEKTKTVVKAEQVPQKVKAANKEKQEVKKENSKVSAKEEQNVKRKKAAETVKAEPALKKEKVKLTKKEKLKIKIEKQKAKKAAKREKEMQKAKMRVQKAGRNK